jgi:hypothetical protein
MNHYLSVIINHHYLTTDEELEVDLHALLVPALVAGEWSASLLDHFIPGEMNRWLGGPQSRSGLCRRTYCSCHEPNSDSSVV